MDHSTILIREHEILVDICGSSRKPLLQLTFPMAAQTRDRRNRERYPALPRPGLRLTNLKPACRPTAERAADGERSGLKIDIRPP